MKHYPWILFTGGLLALAFAPGACGGSNSGSGGAGGGAGGSTTTTSTTTTTTTTGVTTGPTSSSSSGTPTLAVCDAPADAPSNGACFTGLKQPPACPHPDMDGGTDADGGALDCSSLFQQPTACGTCLMGTCCQELSDCQANTACWTCFNDQTGQDPSCQDQTAIDLLDKITLCANGCCTADCFDPGCNPVTNDGCDTEAGEACDLASSGDFICFPAEAGPNDTPICETCSNESGPFCEPTHHCNEDTDGNGACARYCCDDGDCGANGKCDTSGLQDGVGLCVPK